MAIIKPVIYKIKVFNTHDSSRRYGNCEVCGKPVNEVYHLTALREYKSGHFTWNGGFEFWGHIECFAGVCAKHSPIGVRDKLNSPHQSLIGDRW